MAREFDTVFLESGTLENTEEHERVRKHLLGALTATERKGSARKLALELHRNPVFDGEYARKVEGVLTRYLVSFCRGAGFREGLILAVGIGNEGLTADALGPQTVKRLTVTEHLVRSGVEDPSEGRLAAIESNVSGVTGIASFDIVKGVCERVHPALVIAIDTLASRKRERLARMIQMSDGGIVPGGGVGNAKTAFDRAHLGVPVIAIGVPLVIYARHLAAEYAAASATPPKGEEDDLVVTLKEIDLGVKTYAAILAGAVNGAVRRLASHPFSDA